MSLLTKKPDPDVLFERLAKERSPRAFAFERSDHVGPARSPHAKTRFLKYSLSHTQAPDAAHHSDATGAEQGRDDAALAHLIVVDGPDEGQVYPLTGPVSFIGRAEGQDVQLSEADTTVSRNCHASITFYGEAAGFVLRDGMKPNPTLLNGRSVAGERAIRHGDILQVGRTQLLFRCP